MATLNVNGAQILAAGIASPGYHAYARGRAERINAAALQVFNMRQLRDNEGRVSETTPPKYKDEFYVKRDGNDWIAGNSDPGATMVEFGALAGGRTPVLKYRPMGTALDIVSGEVAAGE